MLPGVAQVYNPSPVWFGDEITLLVSIVLHRASGRGRDVGQTHVARAKDGVHFTVDEEPFILWGPDEPYPWNIVSTHFIDNRVTRIGDEYYILTPVMCRDGWDAPAMVLGRTRDFKSYERIEITSLPKNRGASLFPEKIGGKYYRLERPGGGDGSGGEIWLSSSPDLIHWGCCRPVLQPNYRYWNLNKIGPTPPVRTDHGWLDIIHGVFTPAGGSHYYIGAMLLDLEEPWKVIGRTNGYLLRPEMSYETNGNCDNVVFPCGMLADTAKDEAWLYYGATDDKICLAKGKLSEIVTACLEGW
jgi:predicted GH43/DUF377 family glycosyl hydrolase